VISENKDGYLTCSKDNGGFWCEHVQSHVKNGEDAELIWSIPDAGVQVVIQVPITPTHNQWQEVELHCRKVRGAYYAKALCTVSQYQTPGWVVDLGMLSPGEGRMALRDMVINWFMGSVDGRSFECASSGHGYRQAQVLQSDLASDKAFAQQWSMFTVGTCLSCTYQAPSPDDIPTPDGYVPRFPGN
jgi:hypothetical protein